MIKDSADSFGFLVYDISRLLRDQFNDQAMAYDLTLAQNRALVHLNRNEGVNQATLANILDIQPITLVRQLDKLEQKGLIERRADPHDRRMLRLYLTPKANRLMEDLTSIGLALTEGAFLGVSSKDRERTMSTLQQVKSNLGNNADVGPSTTDKAGS